MHELSIAMALMEQVEEVRLANGGGKVIAVDVKVGAWQLVVPEILSGYFDQLAEGTPLEAAEIRIESVEATARCKECSEEFSVEDNFLVCPECGALGCTLLSGDELYLAGVELD
jgi:hydrogenase nickel incorporation protein HypA/HybF